MISQIGAARLFSNTSPRDQEPSLAPSTSSLLDEHPSPLALQSAN